MSLKKLPSRKYHFRGNCYIVLHLLLWILRFFLLPLRCSQSLEGVILTSNNLLPSMDVYKVTTTQTQLFIYYMPQKQSLYRAWLVVSLCSICPVTKIFFHDQLRLIATVIYRHKHKCLEDNLTGISHSFTRIALAFLLGPITSWTTSFCLGFQYKSGILSYKVGHKYIQKAVVCTNNSCATIRTESTSCLTYLCWST